MVLTVDGIGGGSFDVLVRTVDSEDDVRVFARPGALAMEFKTEALRRLCLPSNGMDR